MHVEIEATNQCNTRCLHCPHEAISRPMGKMDEETFNEVIRKVRAYSPHFSVEFAGMGEPLLNPLIYKFVEELSPDFPTTITTNASALTTRNAEKLIEAGLNYLTISFNGEDPVIYELMMGGLDFERATANLKKVVSLSQGSQLQVRANVSVTRQTQERLADIKNYLNQAGVDGIFFSKCHHRGGFLKGDVVCTTPMPQDEPYRCDIFDQTLFVAWTGEVLSCCHDLAGENIIGDLKTESVEEILTRKRKISADGVKFRICEHCNDLYRFMKDPTPDGRSIADWVYDLYTPGKNNHGQPQVEPPVSANGEFSSLGRWLYRVYEHEDRGIHMLAQLQHQLNEQKTINAALKDAQTAPVQQNSPEVQALRAELDEIYGSHLWRWIVKFRNARLAVIPQGSRREKFWMRFLGAIDR